MISSKEARTLSSADLKYFVASETPLRFHRFLSRFFVPLDLLIWSLILYNSFFKGPLVLPPVVVLLYAALSGLLLRFVGGLMFVFGAGSQSKPAYIGMMLWLFGLPCQGFLFNLVTDNLASVFADSGLLVSAIVVGLFFAPPLFVAKYYSKRKALFFPRLIPPIVLDLIRASTPVDDEDVRMDSASHSKKKSVLNILAVNILLVIWGLLYEVIFVVIAISSNFHPYVLIAISTLCTACGALYSRMSRLSAFERPLIFNSDAFCGAFNIVGIFGYLPLIACFFVDWKIALIGIPICIIGGGLLTGLARSLVAIPMSIMLGWIQKLYR